VPTLELDLQALPAGLRAAVELAWPGCPEAQRRAVLAPDGVGGRPLWPDGSLWPWQPARHWWRPWQASERRRAGTRFFTSHVRDVRGADYAPRLFDPEQPFFETPWTQAEVLLRSPVPETLSDADFWALTQLLMGGDVQAATGIAQDWDRCLRAEGALRGPRRIRWLADAQRRLEMAATGAYL
jgi:hypothetical protein